MTPYKPILTYFSKLYEEAYQKKSLKSLYESLKTNHLNEKIVILINYVKKKRKFSEKIEKKFRKNMQKKGKFF